MQGVLARFVGEVCHACAVRRPGGGPLMRAGRVGEVAYVALLGRHGQDLSTRLEHGAGSSGRQTSMLNPCRDLDKMGPDFGEIAGHVNLYGVRLTALDIVDMDGAELLIDDGARSRRRRLQIETVVDDDLGNGLL